MARAFAFALLLTMGCTAPRYHASALPRRAWRRVLPSIENMDSLVCAIAKAHGDIELSRSFFDCLSPAQKQHIRMCMRYGKGDLRLISARDGPLAPGHKRIVPELYEDYFGRNFNGDLALRVSIAEEYLGEIDSYRGTSTIYLLAKSESGYRISLRLGEAGL